MSPSQFMTIETTSESSLSTNTNVTRDIKYSSINATDQSTTIYTATITMDNPFTSRDLSSCIDTSMKTTMEDCPLNLTHSLNRTTSAMITSSLSMDSNERTTEFVVSSESIEIEITKIYVNSSSLLPQMTNDIDPSVETTSPFIVSILLNIHQKKHQQIV